MPFALGLVALAGTVASAAMQADAAGKAANARQNALANLKKLNIPQIQQDAQAADVSQIANSLATQKSLDPQAAALREKGAQGLLANLSNPDDAKAAAAAERMFSEQGGPDAGLEAVRSSLVADAQHQLALGSSLDPMFQAELVRAGLEGGNTFAPAAKGMAGQTARKLIGSAGIQLEQQRRAAAQGDVAAAQGITTARANILSNLVNTLHSVGTTTQQRAGAAFGVGQGTLQPVGLTGKDVANLSIANTNQQNQATLAGGDIAANRALANGQFLSSLVGGATSFAGGLLGGGGALPGASLYNPMAPGQVGAPRGG